MFFTNPNAYWGYLQPQAEISCGNKIPEVYTVCQRHGQGVTSPSDVTWRGGGSGGGRLTADAVRI